MHNPNKINWPALKLVFQDVNVAVIMWVLMAQLSAHCVVHYKEEIENTLCTIHLLWSFALKCNKQDQLITASISIVHA